jgi:ABC-type transporter Mla subunit MlaD
MRSRHDNHFERLILDELRALRHKIDALHSFVHERFHAMSSTLQSLQDAVTAENSVIDSAVTLIQGLAAEIAALKPTQEAIDALAASVKAKSDALAAAVSANTPASDPPPAG